MSHAHPQLRSFQQGNREAPSNGLTKHARPSHIPLIPVIPLILVILLLLPGAPALSIPVTVRLHGIVQTEYIDTPAIAPGDRLNWEFTYEVDAAGAGSGENVASDWLYRSYDIVTSASATIGNTVFEGPISNPLLDRTSALTMEDGTNILGYDVFQGSMNFNGVADIPRPLIAFYLYDDSGTLIGPNPRHLTTWSDSDLELFDRRRFSIFDYSLPSGGRELATGIITPEPAASCALTLLGAFALLKRRRPPQRSSQNLS